MIATHACGDTRSNLYASCGKGAAPERRLFNGFYCAIFHIPPSIFAQFAIDSSRQIIQSPLWRHDLLAIPYGIWLALSLKREERKAKQ
jgi:hypothetical protein